MSKLFALALGLPPSRVRVGVTRGVPSAMPDGVRLVADHYAPRGPGKHWCDAQPIIQCVVS